MQQTTTYRERSRAFLEKARAELESGDLEQASEKGWAAAALMVKAVAEQRGMLHARHGHLFAVVDTLAGETGDQALRNLFDTANGLHQNFYENWLGVGYITQAIDRVERFLDKMRQILDSAS